MVPGSWLDVQTLVPDSSCWAAYGCHGLTVLHSTPTSLMTIRIFEEEKASTNQIGIWAYVGSHDPNGLMHPFALQKFCNSLLIPRTPVCFWFQRMFWRKGGCFECSVLCHERTHDLSERCAKAAQGSMIKKICRYPPWPTDPVAPSISPLSTPLTTGQTQPWWRLRHPPLPWNGVVGKSKVAVATPSGHLDIANDRRHPCFRSTAIGWSPSAWPWVSSDFDPLIAFGLRELMTASYLCFL